MGAKVYLIADTHFRHENIIKYCSRPFKDVTHMNEVLIKNWNEVVGPEDIVWHLGDFALGSREEISRIFTRLNGRKKLIMGNHDRLPEEVFRKIGFETVSRYPIVYDKSLILSHAPLAREICIGELKNIYGHVHNHYDEYAPPGTGHCVSVENIDYTPILLSDVMKNIK